MPLTVGPVLVLTGNPDAQQAAFHDRLPPGREAADLRRAPRRPRDEGRPRTRSRSQARVALARRADPDAGHQLPALGELSVGGRRARRPGRGGRLDARTTARACRRLVDRAHDLGLLDSLLHAERPHRGRVDRAGRRATTSARSTRHGSAFAPPSPPASTSSRPISTKSCPRSSRRRGTQAAAPLRWYKGNTHTHTLNSDGDSTPDEVARWYREHGYQFLVLSDHNFLTSVDGLNALHGADERFLLIRGEEVTDGFGGKPIHVNGLALDRLVTPQGGASIVETHSAERERDQDGQRRAAHQPPELPVGDHRRGAHRGPEQQAVRGLQRPSRR